MAQENIWRDQFMAELNNEEVNRELCALAVEEMFESWSPETQEAVLEEWNDWQNDEPATKKSKFSCAECGKSFTRPGSLKRHVQLVHSGKKSFLCERCSKSFATLDTLKRHEKTHQEKSYECSRCHKKFGRKVCRVLC